MRILISLPEAKHYRPLQSQVEGRYLWQDKGSSLIRIAALDPRPWGKEWLLIPFIQKAKNDTYQYPARLDFKCLPALGGGIALPLVREVVRGKFAYPQGPTHLFFCFPVETDEKTVARNPEQMWLLYSVLVRV